MFERYGSYEQPNNISTPKVATAQKFRADGLQLTTDACNNIRGLSWSINDTFTYELPKQISLTVPFDSLILDVQHLVPTAEDTDYRYAYNTIDNKCWKYGTDGTWQLLDFIYYEDGGALVATFDVGQAHAVYDVLDFRGNKLFTSQTNTLDSTVLSDVLRQGTYTLVYRLKDANEKSTSYAIKLVILGAQGLDLKVSDECANTAVTPDVAVAVSRLQSTVQQQQQTIDAMLHAPMYPGSTVFESIIDND